MMYTTFISKHFLLAFKWSCKIDIHIPAEEQLGKLTYLLYTLPLRFVSISA